MLSSVLPGTLTRQCLRRHYKKGVLSIWMKFLVRMFWWMVSHILYLEKGNGDVLYHLPEKWFVPDENQIKWSIFSGTCDCGQMIQKFPGILVKARRREYLERYYPFSENIPPRWTVPFKISMELPKIPFKWCLSAQVQITVLKPELTISDKLWAGCPTTNKKFC